MATASTGRIIMPSESMDNNDKLREAIKDVRDRLTSMPKGYFRDDYLAQAELIVAAAESTLPKIKTVEMKRWALFVHGQQVNITEDAHMAEMWKRGCVGEDFVVEFTGAAEVPA